MKNAIERIRRGGETKREGRARGTEKLGGTIMTERPTGVKGEGGGKNNPIAETSEEKQ